MPSYFSYVGKFDSPGFFWNDPPDEKFRQGNTPEKIIPKDFSLGLGFAPGAIDYWTKKFGSEGKQIDWSAWGVIVCKADLEMIWKTEKEGRWTDEKEWLDIWEQIEALQDDQKYILVVAENPSIEAITIDPSLVAFDLSLHSTARLLLRGTTAFRY